MKTIYFVIPVYNEEAVIEKTSQKINEIIENLISQGKLSNESKILFADDGSKDNTWEIITELNGKNERIKGIKFAKNYGQQNAIYAGFMQAKDHCDAAISLDADLQDDISLIEDFIEKFSQGYEIVIAAHNDRTNDNFAKKFISERFYDVMKFLNKNTIKNHSEFRLISNSIIERLSKHNENDLFLRGLIPTLSDKIYVFSTLRNPRIAGSPKYTLAKSFELALNGITSFSIKPIRLIMIAGILIMFLSLLWFPISLNLFSIWFLGGLQIFSIGIIGEYIAKTYFETKKRPRYIIEKNL